MKNIAFPAIRADTGKTAVPTQPMTELVGRLLANPPVARRRPARSDRGAFVTRFVQTPAVVSPDRELQGLFAPLSDSEWDDLSIAGWGIALPEAEREVLIPQLAPLLEMRQAQVGSRYKVFTYRPDESMREVLERHGLSPVEASPEDVPHYLLLVGDPAQVAFSSQYSLDRLFSVGRLALDQPEDYGRYARNVVRHEHRTTSRRKATLFGTIHPDESTSALSAAFLIQALGRRIANSVPATHLRLDTRTADAADKRTLSKLMGGALTPDFLLTATHGVMLPPGHARRRHLQGAILCAEYPGAEGWHGKAIPPRMMFSGQDVTEDRDFNGMLALLFGCNSGGTPQRSSFPLEPHHRSLFESHEPFMAHLPRRMLAVQNGCRAVVAHVDTVYNWSFANRQKQEQTGPFQGFVKRLLEGRTVGYAMNLFQESYLEKTARYLELVASHNEGDSQMSDDELVHAWLAVNDMRNYVLFGDPAVRLPQLNL
ncbi:hypothetical protein SCOR_19030 [Sulfidibacter corallicola]|uniref:Uncharacterized protein n=1 Tax=Sulfidibacter corallicola TaxID=2818388 RepID=A0A8A4TVR6_SULCO|nr:hypothetical protein [Sulfidibacter corallicola]QTD53457.1 hypothetical protein J3U87_13465 [Sulfidibacter corallicola]